MIAPMFLGRRLDPLTLCYGAIPVEAAEEVRDWAELHYGEIGQGLAVMQKCDDLKAKFEKKGKP